MPKSPAELADTLDGLLPVGDNPPGAVVPADIIEQAAAALRGLDEESPPWAN